MVNAYETCDYCGDEHCCGLNYADGTWWCRQCTKSYQFKDEAENCCNGVDEDE